MCITGSILSVKSIENWNWPDTWGLVGTGLVVVFMILILLVVFLEIMGKITSSRKLNKDILKNEHNSVRLSKRLQGNVNNRSHIHDAGAEKLEKEENDYIPEEIVAVITAAVAMINSRDLGDIKNGVDSGVKYMIKDIKPVKNTRSAWAAAGINENTRPF